MLALIEALSCAFGHGNKKGEYTLYAMFGKAAADDGNDGTVEDEDGKVSLQLDETGRPTVHPIFATAIESAVAVLVDDLRDGPGNARVAAVALFGFGPPVIEALRPYVDDHDQQCRESVRSIIERLEHPDRTWDQCENRMPRISWTTHDPLSLDFWEATSR